MSIEPQRFAIPLADEVLVALLFEILGDLWDKQFNRRARRSWGRASHPPSGVPSYIRLCKAESAVSFASSSGSDFMNRGTESKAARASASVIFGLWVGPTNGVDIVAEFGRGGRE